MITHEERERTVELIQVNRYLALATVSRFLRPEIFVDVAQPKVTQVTRDFMAAVKVVLDGLCSMPNARVGKLSQEDARNYFLHGSVYYSTAWMARQKAAGAPLTAAGQVGLSIYEELQEIFEQLHKATGKPMAALAYPSVAVLARMGVRNHQDIVVVGDFCRFLGIFMRTRLPPEEKCPKRSMN